MNPQHCIQICNGLLRGERSALETYDQAIAAHKSGTRRPEIARIRDQHRDAVIILTENVRAMGGSPDLEDGAWGAFAHPLDQAEALRALQNGERTGQKKYESALTDEEVMPKCKDLISSQLLPRIKEHVETLQNLQKVA